MRTPKNSSRAASLAPWRAPPVSRSLVESTDVTAPFSRLHPYDRVLGCLPSLSHTYPVSKAVQHEQQPLIPPLPNFASAEDGAPSVRTFTVVLDLDETLCSNRMRVTLRPHAIDLIKSLNALSSATTLVEVVLWTASVESVARPVVNRIDPSGVYFRHCIFRDSRWFREIGFTKDLRRLGRDMKSTVIVENSPLSVRLNRRNAILVKDYFGGVADTELEHVKTVLTDWIQSGAPDVAEYLAVHPLINARTNEVSPPPRATISHRTTSNKSALRSVAAGGVRGIAALRAYGGSGRLYGSHA